MELYEQLTPTRVYSAYKTGTTDKNNVTCRMCGEGSECLAHVLAGCPSLAQSKYLDRHNAALKVFFFEMLRDLKLADSTPPWFSDVKPKPLYKSTDAEAYWDVPVYADHMYVRSNRVDARFIDHNNKKVLMVEMSCPWVNNREKKDKEKTKKYGALRLELTKQHPGYTILQVNLILDALGGWSKEMEPEMKNIFGARYKDVLLRMQKAVLSCTVNIARTFKLITS
uniref:Uncharacterized protein LOC116305588 n=1 Tax=Actinia tenebrosa TaxID=6105 RepID=A0A6P8IWG3_ACTTE